MAKDALGQELAVGDVIFYGIRAGNSVRSHPSVIKSIEQVDDPHNYWREPRYRLGVAMLSEKFNYRPNDQSSWDKVVTRGYFYSLENAIKLLPEQYSDEIRELLDATRVGR